LLDLTTHILMNTVHKDLQRLQKRSWSPIVWKDGKRCKANFAYARYIALDFDEGYSLSEAQNFLEDNDLRSFIALSKSHGKEKLTASGKATPATDRFRMVIACETACTDLAQYEENLKWWRGVLPAADQSCHDGGRFFFASPKIWQVRDGRRYIWQDFSHLIQLGIQKRERKKEQYKAYYGEVGNIPEKIRDIITRGSSVGSRHKTCYWLGATLAEMGMDESTTVRLIMAGPLGDIGQEEVEEAVSYGRRKALGGSK
jgi:hypothetical protein